MDRRLPFYLFSLRFILLYFVVCILFLCVHPEWIDKTNRRKWPFVIPVDSSVRAIWCPTLFHFLFNQRIRGERQLDYLFIYLFFHFFSFFRDWETKKTHRTKGNCVEPIAGPSISCHHQDQEPSGLATCPSTKDAKLIRYVPVYFIHH